MATKDEEQRKLEEIRRKAEEEEAQRIEEEVARRAEELTRLRKQRGKKREDEEEGADEKRKREEVAREKRRREEEDRKRREEEADEKHKREEDRRRKLDDEDRRRRDEEDRKRREDERRRRDEEVRRKLEDDVRDKIETEVQKKREEEDRKKREEENALRKAEEARRREDEEERRKEEEKVQRRQQEIQERVQNILQKAEEFLEKKEFELAITETEKALTIDSMHVEALALDQKIRSAKAEVEAASAIETEKVKEAPPEAPVPEQFKEPEMAQPFSLERKPPVVEHVFVEKREKPPPPPRPPRPKRPRKPIPRGVIIGAAAVVLAIVAGIVIYQVGIAVYEAGQALLQGKRYIAIFPFASRANTEDEKILGTALAGETGMLLGHYPDARIMDANSSVNLQRFARDAGIRANKLKFAYTVNGTISTAGSNVVLNLDIIDTLGKTMWSGRMEKPRDNLMELPTELARTIAQVFSISLPKESEDVVSRRVTTNAEAYLSYLRGREMLHKRTLASTKAALALFQQAISQDQNFAEAYAAAAYSLFHIYETGWSDDARTLSQAEDLANKASLRRNTVEARTVLGGVYLLAKKYEAALDELNGALTRMPSNAEAERITGLVDAIGGEEGKAIDHVKRAYELDPVGPDVLISAALVHQRFAKPKEAMIYFNQALPFIGDTTTFLAEIAGNALVSSYQYDRAIGIYEQRVALNPRSYIDEYKLARAYQLAGKSAPVWSRAFEKTIANLQREIEDDPQNALAVAYLGLAYSRYGRFSEGEANGKKALKIAPNNLTVKYKLADIYSIQKKKQEAITALREALNSRYILAEIVDLDLFNIGDELEFQQTIVPELQ